MTPGSWIGNWVNGDVLYQGANQADLENKDTKSSITYRAMQAYHYFYFSKQFQCNYPIFFFFFSQQSSARNKTVNISLLHMGRLIKWVVEGRRATQEWTQESNFGF